MTDRRTATVTLKFSFEERDRVNVNLNVLGLIEDGQWCAIALEMGLRGYGSTFDDALSELKDAIKAQVEFALMHDSGNVEQLFFPADRQYIDMFIETNFLKEQLAQVTFRLESRTAQATIHAPERVRTVRRSVSVRVPNTTGAGAVALPA